MSQHDLESAPTSTIRQVERILDDLRCAVGDNLLGVYLHGSLAMGCFNPQRSDIDLLVVVELRLTPVQRREVAAGLLDLSADPSPVEISILQRSDLWPWRHPAPYDLHYSEDWRQHTARALIDGTWQTWGAEQHTDPDLAAHVTVTRARGACLCGAAIADLFPPVPRDDYIASILDDVLSDAYGLGDVVAHPVYAILNACRTLAYLRTGEVLSKAEGGAWAMGVLPADHAQVVREALAAYADDDRRFRGRPTRSLAAYLRGEILCLTSAH